MIKPVSFNALAFVLSLFCGTDAVKAASRPYVAPAPRVAPITHYTIIDLGTLGGKTSSATALNDFGAVVGQAETARGAKHAFLWHRDKMHDLGGLGGNSAAAGINNQGEVVGQADLNPYKERGHAVLWWHERVIDLTDWPDSTGTFHPNHFERESSGAVAINNHGQIVGTIYVAPILWKHGRLRPLGMIRDLYQEAGNWEACDPVAINNRGQVLGSGGTSLTDATFLWEKGKGRNLGRFGVPTDNSAGVTDLFGINDNEQVVGQIDFQAFIWHPGHLHWLAQLPGWNDSEAHGINKDGEVVGYVSHSLATGEEPTRAVVWHGTKVYNLSRLILPGSGWVLSNATAINVRGQIVGVGKHWGHTHAFLLTPKQHDPRITRSRA